MKNLKKLFLLDPDVVFLNHGSFGACPREVIEKYQYWQQRLERQPVLFLMRELKQLEKMVRQDLGNFLGADSNNLTLVSNVTFAVNMIARSINLQPGDEILTTDQEYGACNNIWDFICRKVGSAYIQHPIPFPIPSAEEFLDAFWQGVTPKTKLIFLSHITSPTASRLPIEAVIQRARQQNILTFIDGAHAPGQVKLDLETLGADFYTGNCHKWMLSPKGTGFLYIRPELQSMVEPLVVSRPVKPENIDGYYMNHLAYAGTRDPSASLSISAAISFMEKHHWDEVVKESHSLLQQALGRISDLVGLVPFYLLESTVFSQMGIAPLPQVSEIGELKTRMYDEFQIEVPIFPWKDHIVIRISIQGYNSQEDIDRLINSLSILLPQYTS